MITASRVSSHPITNPFLKNGSTAACSSTIGPAYPMSRTVLLRRLTDHGSQNDGIQDGPGAQGGHGRRREAPADLDRGAPAPGRQLGPPDVCRSGGAAGRGRVLLDRRGRAAAPPFPAWGRPGWGESPPGGPPPGPPPPA